MVPHWPPPYGLGADPIHQLIIDDELRRAGVKRPENGIGIGWAAPTIAMAGTPEQQARYLPKIFSGEEFWCQMFSEPEAGSDLANLATRAVRDGDEYVVNGSKIWTSGGHKRPVRHPHRPHRPRRAEAQGHLVLHLPDGPSGPHADADHRHDHRALVQPGVLRQRAPARQPARGRRGRRVAPGQGDAGQRASLVVVGRRAVGCRPVVRRPARPRAPGRRHHRPVASPGPARLHAEAKVLDLNRMRTLTARLAASSPGRRRRSRS